MSRLDHLVDRRGLPPLPGAIGMSRVRAYDTPAPDGLRSGTPHVHFACTECYVVLAGRGSVQTLSAQGYRELPLEPGSIAWFEPGTIHRDVNADGALEILTIMQNGGLPEAGDHVLAFPQNVLEDADSYARAQSLGEPSVQERRARERRDLAVEGFLTLQQSVLQDGADALDDFYRAAIRLVEEHVDAWEELWRAGPQEVVERTGTQLKRLRQGDISYLRDAAAAAFEPVDAAQRYAMCGVLTPISEALADGS